MRRIPVLDEAEMTDTQRRLAENIKSTHRGRLGGPFSVWVRLPKLLEAARNLDAQLRSETYFPHRLRELAILVACRHFTAQYAWGIHAPIAAGAGLDTEVIAAIRVRRRPDFGDDEDGRLVYATVSELLESGAISDATYRAAEDRFSDLGMIELVAMIGFYSMIALTLIAFQIPPKDGAKPQLEP